MNRPTKAEVDDALIIAGPDTYVRCTRYECILAAEVRALREELVRERRLTASYRKGAEESGQRWNAIDDYDQTKVEVQALRAENERLEASLVADKEKLWTHSEKQRVLQAEINRMIEAVDYLESQVDRSAEYIVNGRLQVGVTSFVQCPPSVIELLYWHVRNLRGK